MAFSSSSLHHFLIISCFSLLFTLSQQTSLIPNALVIPVTKDTSSKRPQYTTLITAKTPSVPLKLTLDLSGRYVWLASASANSSSTYRSVRCKNPACTARLCNPITRSKATGKLGSDVVSLRPELHVITAKPKRLIFAASAKSLLREGLASGAAGVAGLSHKPTGLPSQLSTLFKLPQRFSLCLASSPEPDQGFVAFGGEPDSQPLTYTPLLQNPKRPSEYFVGVASISIDGTAVPGLSSDLFSFNAKTGRGGTEISTTEPYPVLQTTIFSKVVKAFDKAVPANFPRVQAVSPFGACYATEGFEGLSPMVPRIDLVLENKGSVWSIFGPNSMVRIGDGLVCLGFIDGGSSPSTSMVIGGQMIEDNLLHFDLAGSKLGFTSSLLERKTSCSGINFTTNRFRF